LLQRLGWALTAETAADRQPPTSTTQQHHSGFFSSIEEVLSSSSFESVGGRNELFLTAMFVQQQCVIIFS
jgi:hypothetical protein